MYKKINIWLLLVMSMTTVVYNSCEMKDEPQEEKPVPEEPKKPKLPSEGTEVTINGVTWATRNLAAPGTFVADFQDFGMYYQWNRKAGWSAYDPLINSDGGTTWDNTPRSDISWTKENDPSPEGWRIPTRSEINTLIDEDKVLFEWTTVNSVKGYFFTDKTTGKSLFLPAAGNRDRNNGALSNLGHGYYWSNTIHNNDYVYYLLFSSSGIIEYSCFRNIAQSIRCVKE